MKLKFVDNETVEKALSRNDGLSYRIAQTIEELYKHPNQWAEFGEPILSSSTGARIRNKYNNIEVKLTGGNNLPNNHPDKKAWTMYIRYTPETEQDDTF